jgi:hypothetical protein
MFSNFKLKTTLVVFFCFAFAEAQEITKTISINKDIRGEVYFQYYLKNKDTIYNGAFQFNSTQEKKDSEVISSINYKGEYQDNLKIGKWLFSKKELTPLEKLIEKDYKIQFSTRGEEHQIKANFSAGAAEGRWQVVEQLFEDAQPTDTILNINADFANNNLAGPFEAQSKNLKIIGSLNEESFLHEDWEVTHQSKNQNLKELKIYNNGVMVKHDFIKEQDSLQINYLGLDQSYSENETWVNVDDKDLYFEVLEMSMLASNNSSNLSKDYLDAAVKANEFLKNSFSAFAYYDSKKVWGNFQESESLTLGRFKLRKYPYTSAEVANISKIIQQSEEVESTLNSFFNNPQVELGKLSYEDLNRYEAIFQQYQNASNELKNVIEQISKPAFEYVDRQAIFPTLEMEFNFDEEISYKFEKEIKKSTHTFPEKPEAAKYSIQSIASWVEKMHLDVLRINKEIQLIFEDLSKQEELSDDEALLLAKKANILFLFSNQDQRENYNQFHEAVAKDVINYTEFVVEEYAKLAIEAKKDEIENALLCLDQLRNAYVEIADIPRKLERLDDVYTRTSFNPYLMVDMSERIKERVYKAFEDYLFPSLLNELKREINCNSFPATLNELEKIYNRMVVLSDQDTSTIEKELRRERDANVIKKILFQ